MHPQRSGRRDTMIAAFKLRRWSFGLGVLAVAAMWTAALVAQETRTVITLPTETAAGRTADKAVETIGIRETLILRSESGLRIKEVVVSRPDILEFKQIEGQPNVISVVGKRTGMARVTIVDEKGVATVVNVKVVRPATDLQRLVNQQFPTAAVKVEGGEGAIMVTGAVDSTEAVDPIIRFVEAAAGGSVINAIRVSGVMQVELDVCIAQVSRTEIRSMGFNFLHTDEDTVISSTVGSLIPTSRPITGPGVTTQGENFLSPAGRFSAVPTSDTNFAFGIIDPTSAFFGFLSALRSEGVAKVLANPKLVALNGKEATFRVGGTLLIPIEGGFASTLEKQPFGTELVFIPTILGDGKIRLEVNPSVTSIDDSRTIGGVPSTKDQKVRTTIELESGQTFAIGGLLQTESTANASKVPILGDLPFAGVLFRAVRYEETEQELLILVTPKLVDPLDCSQRTTKLPGQETRTPTDFELFLEGILEAPRGPREVCVDGCYKASHWPCEDGYCPNGNCAPGHVSGHVVTAPPTYKAAPVMVSEPRRMPVSPVMLIEQAGESPTPRR